MKLDITNWRILELLQMNARASLKEIAKEVGLSSPTVAERIQKLEDAGVIEGYRAKINLEHIGYRMSVFISAKIRFGQMESFRSVIEAMPEITECHSLTGNDCLLLRAYVRNTQHLEELNTTLKSFGELTTSLILSSLIEDKIHGHNEKVKCS